MKFIKLVGHEVSSGKEKHINVSGSSSITLESRNDKSAYVHTPKYSLIVEKSVDVLQLELADL